MKMVRDDIIAGLKNGLERGASIEASKRSLLSAGYAPEEVQEAVDSLSADSVLSMQQQPPLKRPADSVRPSRSSNPSASQQAQQPVAKQGGSGFFAENWKVIALIVVLLILIAVFVLVLLFRDTIAGWFS